MGLKPFRVFVVTCWLITPNAFGGGSWDFSSADFFPSSGNLDDLLAGRAPRSERVRIALTAYLELTRTVTPGHLALLDAAPEAAPASVDFRAKLAAAGFAAPPFDRYRWRDREENGYRIQFAYLNCQDDAFKTAAETFDDRSARYGANSVELERWVDAQIRVFSHCAGDSHDPPEPADRRWRALERHDRAYQIAATHFYAERYAAAVDAFVEIAADASSPWRDIAAYLVARTQLRRARLEDSAVALQAAARQSDRLMKDATFRERFPAISDLDRQISFRRDPNGTVERLANAFLDDPETMSSRDFADLVFFLTHRPHNELTEWAHEAIHGPLRRRYPGSSREPIAWTRFQQTHRIEWLILAMAESSATDRAGKLEQLANAAAQHVSPRAKTLPFKRLEARLAGWLGRHDEAQAIANDLLARDNLPVASRNRVRLLLAENAASWSEFVDHASITPANLFVLDQPHPRRPTIDRTTRLLTPGAATTINAHLGATTMIEQAERADIGRYLAGRFAIAAWTRAVIAGDTKTARRSADAIAGTIDWLAPAMRDYLDGDDPAFEAALILVKTPGLSPFVPADAGRVTFAQELLRDDIAGGLSRLNWWCPMPADGAAGPLPTRLDATITPAERAALSAVPAQRWGPPILRYAEKNPADPRVPEALHRVVFATRHACRGGPGEISRQAFELLHENYPTSDWAAKTPYWYD